MTTEAKTPRRHSDEFKAQVLAQCAAPGASIAAVAKSHHLCANLVHKWRRGRGAPKLGNAEPGCAVRSSNTVFIAVPLPAATIPAATPPAAHACPIRIELKQGALALSITWPISAAPDLATWTRELLR